MLDRSAEVAAWVGARLPGGDRGFGECAAIGVEHDGRLVAGVVFNNWSPEGRTIELTAASETRRWLTRPVLRAVFGYAFAFCDVVLARTDAGNGHIRDMATRWGALEAVIPHGRGLGRDEAVLILTRDEWARWKT